MLRQDPSRLDTDRSNPPPLNEVASPEANTTTRVDIQRELNRIEEIIFDSLHIPLTRLTLIDEEQVLSQLNLVRINLPDAFAEAQEILQQREEILLQAEEYAQEIIAAAQRKAEDIIDEMGLVQQAQMESRQIRQQVQLECEAIEEEAYAEMEQQRLKAKQELEQWRESVLAECEAMEEDAQEYAESVLGNIEQQLADMTRVIRNGKQQLQREREATTVSRTLQQRSAKKTS
jgi:F0F1-type ATP synthase membrane subunit b/b'